MMNAQKIFLHGLESSSLGFKARYFADHFPEMVIPDFSGDLADRLAALEYVCQGRGDELLLVGSSFGGLMATCFAVQNPHRVKKIILLAPALNFADYAPPQEKLSVKTLLFIGDHDTVTPPDKVIPLAQATFSNLHISRHDDDHMLHKIFLALDWKALL